MGKKQRLKKERQAKQPSSSSRARKARAYWPWLVGVAVFLIAAITVIIIMARMNQDRLLRFSLVAGSQQVEQDLDRALGRFTINDGQALKAFLNDLRTMAVDPRLNAPVAANLNFVLNVIKEIVRQGDLKPEELDKIKALLHDTQRRLESTKAKPKP